MKKIFLEEEIGLKTYSMMVEVTPTDFPFIARQGKVRM